MSYLKAVEPQCVETSGTIDLRIEPIEKDLGGFTVRRVLPSKKRKTVGPFVFFDHAGPAEFAAGQGIEVRPHPHIGIATITYLFEGEIIHRDSLGHTQAIHQGAVNLMTAGRGIVHSERAGDDFNSVSRLHGIQSWMALPVDQEEMEPAFVHYPEDTLPQVQVNGVTVRVIIGEAYGQSSPVTSALPMLYLECRLPEGSTLQLPASCKEQAAYVVTGEVRIDGENYADGVMAIADTGKTITLEALEDSRVMVIGGDPISKRYLWWNFVSSSRDRIEQAKDDWKQGRFEMVPDDDEFIPLPD